MRSAPATRAQDGFVRHAAVDALSVNAVVASGRWVAARTPATSSGTSAAKTEGKAFSSMVTSTPESPSRSGYVHSFRLPASGDPCYGIATTGAWSCFQPYGEHLYLCDTAADGHHPGSWYRVNGGSWHNVQYNVGNGNCGDLNLAIGESGYIDIQACNYEGSTELNCSGIRRVSANG